MTAKKIKNQKQIESERQRRVEAAVRRERARVAAIIAAKIENVKEEIMSALNQVAAEARERGYDGSLSLSDYSDWANDFDVADMPDLAARVRELCDW